MKDGQPKQPKSLVHIVVDRLTIMALCFAGLGALLIWKGYHGDLLIGGAITCAGAVGAILASPRSSQPAAAGELSVTASASTAEPLPKPAA